MRANLLKDVIVATNKIQRTLAIEGAPGGGKTSIVHQAGEELGIPVVERHMPTMLVEDFGILYPDDKGEQLTYKLPHWFPVKGKAPERGILLFDDRNQCGPDLQKVLANICQARNLHGHYLPSGWQVISTGNRKSDRAGAGQVLTHLRNRETVVELETHLDDSIDWMAANGVRPEVMAFLRFRPGLLHEFDPQRDANPTPRSWVEGVSNLLDVVPSSAEYECIKGAVGEGAAAEFTGFLRIWRKLPDPDLIIADPTNAAIPTDSATLYAICGALAHRSTGQTFDTVVTYVNRIPAKEFSVLTVKMAVSRDPSLMDTQAFTSWGVTNQDVLW